MDSGWGRAAVHGLMTRVRGLGQWLVSRVRTIEETSYLNCLKYLDIPGTCASTHAMT